MRETYGLELSDHGLAREVARAYDRAQQEEAIERQNALLAVEESDFACLAVAHDGYLHALREQLPVTHTTEPNGRIRERSALRIGYTEVGSQDNSYYIPVLAEVYMYERRSADSSDSSESGPFQVNLISRTDYPLQRSDVPLPAVMRHLTLEVEGEDPIDFYAPVVAARQQTWLNQFPASFEGVRKVAVEHLRQMAVDAAWEEHCMPRLTEALTGQQSQLKHTPAIADRLTPESHLISMLSHAYRHPDWMRSDQLERLKRLMLTPGIDESVANVIDFERTIHKREGGTPPELLRFLEWARDIATTFPQAVRQNEARFAPVLTDYAADELRGLLQRTDEMLKFVMPILTETAPLDSDDGQYRWRNAG
jgi:hypothetical protein